MLSRAISLFAPAALALTMISPADRPGYSDTPVIPGQKWRVHDKDRPYPPIVTPGQRGSPPSDAVVLFDGKSFDGWVGNGGEAAKWKLVEDGAMEVVGGTGDLTSKAEFGDCQLHVEFATPSKVDGEGQHRGNSGVFLMGRYELQVLDSFENATYADGQAASVYGQHPPLVNACRKPGEWQSYDVVWIAPRFKADGTLETPPRITVLHNGVVVHHDAVLIGPVQHAGVANFEAHPPVGPLRLQDHGNPMRFRNIWVRKLSERIPEQERRASTVTHDYEERPLRGGEIALRDYALSFPGTREEFPWGHCAIKVGGKIFVTFGASEESFRISVKLPESGKQALEMPNCEPTHYGLGKHGWVTATFGPFQDPQAELVKGWIAESYRAIAPKKLAAQGTEPEKKRRAAAATEEKSKKSGKMPLLQKTRKSHSRSTKIKRRSDASSKRASGSSGKGQKTRASKASTSREGRT